MILKITVPGEAIPQGSTRAFIPRGWHRPVITGDNRRTKSWRVDVQAATERAMTAQGTWTGVSVGPVRLVIDCVFIRPASVSAKRRPSVTVKPDLDKLVRSIGDALTDLLWRDDAQIIEIIARKSYAPPGDPAHTTIHVQECQTTAPSQEDARAQ